MPSGDGGRKVPGLAARNRACAHGEVLRARMVDFSIQTACFSKVVRMPRGGARKGAGRKKGGQNFQLQAAPVEKPDGGPTRAERMRAMKRQVVLCVADDMAVEKIAVVMGMTVDRLQAVFGHELEHGKAIVRAEELMRLDAASGDGKVAASKLLHASAKTAPEKSTHGATGKAAVSLNARLLRVLDGVKSQ